MTTNKDRFNVQWPLHCYFTMEIALEPGMPTYGGGLGVLAGEPSGEAVAVISMCIELPDKKGNDFCLAGWPIFQRPNR